MQKQYLDKGTLKNFISDDRLSETIRNLIFQLNEFSKHNKSHIDYEFIKKLLDALIINSAKLHELEYDKVIGTVDLGNQKIARAEVRKAVLYIIDQLPSHFWTLSSKRIEEVCWEIQREIYYRSFWNEAPDLKGFIGRHQELEDITHLINEDIKVLLLLGIGGVGKSSLAAKLAELNSGIYNRKIWISLKNAPTLSEIVSTCIKFIIENPDAELPSEIDEKVKILLELLTTSKNLIIIDNSETILQSQKSEQYLPGFENWGIFFNRICTYQHISTFIITSREKPKEIKNLEQQSSRIKTYKVCGLKNLDAQKILERHNLIADFSQKNNLIQKYSGNPLALNIVSNYIYEFFNKSVNLFLKEKDITFDDIDELLEEQFTRLCFEEQEILYWLAINREPINVDNLIEDLISARSELNFKSKTIGIIIKLAGKHLLEYTPNCDILLQNVIMEFITQKIINNSINDIIGEKTNFISRFCLVKATAKDYLRLSQKRLILQPIIEGVKKLTFYNINTSDFRKLICDLIEAERVNPNKFNYTIGNLLNICNATSIDLSDFNFSNLTVLQAFLREVELHRVNFTNAHIEKSIFAETLSSIFCVSYNETSDIFAVGDYSGDIHLWKLSNKKKITTLKGHTKPVWSLAFSQDGKLLVSGGDDNAVKLWDIENSICRYSMTEHKGIVRSVGFSPIGNSIVSGSWDKTVKIWNLNGVCLKTLTNHTGWVRTVKFSNNGKLLASAGIDNSNGSNIYIWNTDNYSLLAVIKEAHEKSIFHLDFNLYDNFLASGGADNDVKIWDLTNLDNVKLYDTLKSHENEVHNVIFTPDNKYLFSCGQDKTIKVWEINNERFNLKQTLKGHTSWVWALAYCLNETILLSGSADQSVKFWDINKGICISTIQGKTDWVLSLAFKSDKSIMAVGSQDKVIRIWDLKKEKCIKTLKGHTDQIPSVCISPNGQLLASGGWDGLSKVWELNNYRCQFTFKHNSTPWSVSINHENRLLGTGSNDSTISIWNLLNGVLEYSFNGHDGFQIYGIAFHPSENILLSSGWDGKIKLWDIDRKTQIFSFEGSRYEKFTCATFSPDGKYFAACSREQNIYIFDYYSKENITTIIKGHSDWINSISFINNNELLSGSSDKTVKIWGIYTGKCLHTISNHNNKINCVKADIVNCLFASGSSDEKINLYSSLDVTSVCSLRAERIYEGTIITNVTGLSNSQKMTLISLGAIDSNTIINN